MRKTPPPSPLPRLQRRPGHAMSSTSVSRNPTRARSSSKAETISTRTAARSSTRRANRTSTALKVRLYRWARRQARVALQPTTTIAAAGAAGQAVAAEDQAAARVNGSLIEAERPGCHIRAFLIRSLTCVMKGSEANLLLAVSLPPLQWAKGRPACVGELGRHDVRFHS